MAGRLCIHLLATLCASVASNDDTCLASANCYAHGEDSDEWTLLQNNNILKSKLKPIARTDEVTAPKAAMPEASETVLSEGRPLRRQKPLLILTAAALVLFGCQSLFSTSTSSVLSFGIKSASEATVTEHARNALPPGILVSMMACAFLSEASCTAVMPTAHLCTGGLSATIVAWFLGRLLSTPLFWQLEKRGLTQMSLAVHCVVMIVGQLLYGISAAVLLLPSVAPEAATASKSPAVFFHFHGLLMASRGVVGFASGAQFSASAAIALESGAQQRTKYLCYWALWSGLGALVGPGLGYFSLAGASNELEMLLPGAILAGASLLLLCSLPALVDSKAFTRSMTVAEVGELSPSQLHRAAGAVALNVLMQLLRQAMCLLWEAGTAAVLVKQFGIDYHRARMSALGIVVASMTVLAILARFMEGSDERVVLMWSSAAAALGCLFRSLFRTVPDRSQFLVLAGFVGYAGSFLSLAPMLGFAGKVACSAPPVWNPLSVATWRWVLMGHHMISSAGLATALASLWTPGSAAQPHTPGLDGFVVHFGLLMVFAVQVAQTVGSARELERAWKRSCAAASLKPHMGLSD